MTVKYSRKDAHGVSPHHDAHEDLVPDEEEGPELEGSLELDDRVSPDASTESDASASPWDQMSSIEPAES